MTEMVFWVISRKGRAEEREELRAEYIIRMRSMNLSDEDIARILNLDIDYVRQH